ncbi:Gfo/Idh/MocA family protein [Liquorilactobacillus sicerae]|uniref:Gfo/Idh/MocA family protein n=1 Tax=Liquorilactobacillus sicerae TaxID=1416943 RepID=UPI00247FFAA8|nr:Gfo/Idh/MocA family oxidoreductase [Liquorilactobacillus sicerae]
MVVKLGLIGCGAIARTHVINIKKNIKNAKIVAIYDLYLTAAQKLIEDTKIESKICYSIDELINENIDAVMICSRNDAHLEPILKAIHHNKYVFTEKPLVDNAKDCKKIIAAEISGNKRLIQVGFMRRYDPFYQEMKTEMTSGNIGEPLMGYCRHFTTHPATSYFKTENMINDAFIHEIDILHWLFEDRYQSIQVQFARQNSLNINEQLYDPQIVTIKFKKGAIVNTYLSQNSQYGYDVMCQIIGEKGIVQLPDMPSIETRYNQNISRHIDKDWTKRFDLAYKLEIKDFINRVAREMPLHGPSSWDGYIAAVTADAAIQSQKNQKPVQISYDKKPDFY